MSEIKPTQQEFEVFINTDTFKQELVRFAKESRDKTFKPIDKCAKCGAYRLLHGNVQGHEFVKFVSPWPPYENTPEQELQKQKA